MKKTLVALFVALCMVLTMAPAMAFAADAPQIDSVVFYADGKDADEALGVTGSVDQTFVVNLKNAATFEKLGFEVAYGSARYYVIATEGATIDFDKTQYVFSFNKNNGNDGFYKDPNHFLPANENPEFEAGENYEIRLFTFTGLNASQQIKGYETVGDVYQGTIPAVPVEEPELINGFLEVIGDQVKNDNGNELFKAPDDQTVYASLNLEKKLSVLFEITIGDKTYSATAANVNRTNVYTASFMTEVDFINEEAATDNDTLILVPGTYTVTVSTYGKTYSEVAPAHYPIDAEERYSFDITVASADYSRWDALNALIDSFDEMDYTKDAWDDFQEAYAAYFDDKEANYLKPGQAKYYQNNIKEAVTAVSDLVDTLRDNPTANYDYLNAMIAVAEGLDQSDYTADSWKAVETALEKAKKVEPRLPVEDQTNIVDAAAVDLVLAMSRLVGVEKANYAAVDAAIAKAETLTEADYTADSWAAVEAAIDAVVRDLPVSDQAKVDAMAKAINDAIDALVVEKANYAAVDAAIAKAETLTEADYTADSWAAVEAAIDAVVRDLPVSDQAKVDAMAKAINDAIDALVAAEPEDPTDPEDPTEIVFDDVEQGRWSAQYIYDLVEKGICDGIGDNKFNPEGNIERCAFAKILAEASGDDLTRYEGTSNFADCRGSWAETYINWAYANGIVTGRTDTTFDPYGEISRQEMAAMIYRYAEYKGIELPETNELITFDDEEQIADYAAEAVDAMQKAGIINGMDNNEFQPQGTATREQAAKMISVLLSL